MSDQQIRTLDLTDVPIPQLVDDLRATAKRMRTEVMSPQLRIARIEQAANLLDGLPTNTIDGLRTAHRDAEVRADNAWALVAKYRAATTWEEIHALDRIALGGES